MATIQRYQSKGHFLVDVSNGRLSDRRWEEIKGTGDINVTAPEVTTNNDQVFDDGVDPVTWGSDISDMEFGTTEVVWNPGADAQSFLMANHQKDVPVKICFTENNLLYTSPGAGSDTVTYVIAAMTGAFVGSRKLTIASKGTASLPNTASWSDEYFIKIGDEFYRISRRIDATNFVITKDGDDMAVASTIPLVGTASEAEFKVGQFPLILGDKDNGMMATVLSAGESGAARGNLLRGVVSFQPNGNNISVREHVDVGDDSLMPTVAT